jgi:hypothetical protein
LVSQSANPSPWKWPDPWILNSNSIYTTKSVFVVMRGRDEGGRTSQLVAVRGTRENIQPCWDCRSDVRRTYLVMSESPT